MNNSLSSQVQDVLNIYVDTNYWFGKILGFMAFLVSFFDRGYFYFLFILNGLDYKKVCAPDMWFHWLPDEEKEIPFSVEVEDDETDEKTETHPFRNINYQKKLYVSDEKQTMGGIFKDQVKKYPKKNCLGSRRVMKIETSEKIINGEKKQWRTVIYESDKINWETYEQVDERIDDVSRGIKLFTGMNSLEHFGIYENTCAEWMLTSQALFRRNIVCVTVYSTLGIVQIKAALNQSEVKACLIGEEYLGNLLSVRQDVPELKYLIVNQSQVGSNLDDPIKIQQMEKEFDVKIITFADLEKLGKDHRNDNIAPYEKQPTGKDVCILMYTSGSTGNPKGVVITNTAFVSGIEGDNIGLELKVSDYRHVSYLPMAHSMEMISQNFMFFNGGTVLFGTPNTLTDRGAKPTGDLTAAKPTIFVCVPRVLDTMKKSVLTTIHSNSTPAWKRWLFNTAYKHKRHNLRKGYPSPLWDALVFKKLSETVTGGCLEFILVGGAPLNPETQEFVRVCFNAAVILGYGLTETCSSVALQAHTHPYGHNLGAVVPTTEIKLRSIEEMGYSINDKNPRGEIYVRGVILGKEYYKMPKQTAEAYFPSKDDKKGPWFATGDIGEIDRSFKNALKIIDRAKNLVKLSHGEYVAVEKIESTYLKSSFVSPNGILVYGDSLKPYLVAIIVPDFARLRMYCEENRINCSNNDEMCAHPRIREAVKKDFESIEKAAKLPKIECVRNFVLVNSQWTTENEMLTASMKLKRSVIAYHYQKEIMEMFEDDN